MANLAVAGLYNLETNLGIDGFPLPYFPVCYPFHKITQAHAGVGYNVALALNKLGNSVRYATLIGDDSPGKHLRQAMADEQLSDHFVETRLSATPQSVILVAPDGSRQIHCDLKDIQETPYPAARWPELIKDVDAVIACNINFARPLLAEAKNRNLLLATDVHVLSNFDDEYNRDYLAASDILFMSHEKLPCAPHLAIKELQKRYQPKLLIISLGAEGALLAEKGHSPIHQPSQAQRPIVNTIGAGDALFSAFIDQYLRLGSAGTALKRAQIYAGWKIGESGASAGLMNQAEFMERIHC